MCNYVNKKTRKQENKKTKKQENKKTRKQKNKKGHCLFFYANKLYTMSKSQKIQIPFPGSTPRVVHMAASSLGNVSGTTNPIGKIPTVVVKFKAPKSTLKRKGTIGGKYRHKKKHTMRKSKKSRKQTKKKGKSHQKNSNKSRKSRN